MEQEQSDGSGSSCDFGAYLSDEQIAVLRENLRELRSAGNCSAPVVSKSLTGESTSTDAFIAFERDGGFLVGVKVLVTTWLTYNTGKNCSPSRWRMPLSPHKENKMKIASFDVDAQKGFTPICPDELPVAGGDEIVEELNAQARFADIRVGSKDWHPAGAAWETTPEKPIFSVVGLPNVDIRWPQHCVAGTTGAELLDGLPNPTEYDFFVYKGQERDMHPYGACYRDLANEQSTGVIEYLTAQGIDWVIVGGLALDYCVKTTAIQLRDAGFRVLINLLGTRPVADESAATAWKEMIAKGVDFVADAEGIDEFFENMTEGLTK